MKVNLKFRKEILLLFLGIFLTSCISHIEEQLIDEGGVVAKVSFKDNVKPIVDAKCTSCHSPSGGTSPDLTGYANVKAKADRVKARVGNGTMPQSGPLPQAQMDIILNWVDEGALDN
ncbi:MAG: cytochrome c [Polaribacter sp.]|uniref:c-type cytochrome n=1 Tax=Polaribacter sp. TaxID=1920175 RepID=UPI002F34FC9E